MTCNIRGDALLKAAGSSPAGPRELGAEAGCLHSLQGFAVSLGVKSRFDLGWCKMIQNTKISASYPLQTLSLLVLYIQFIVNCSGFINAQS